MAKVDNRIYNLARQLCKNLPEDIPEGLLYGYIKMASMSEEALRDYLKKGGVEDVESAISEINTAKEVIDKQELDPELLKNGLQLVLMKRADDKENVKAYEDVIDDYDESTSIARLVEDAVSGIPEEELTVFKQGSKLSDIVSYSKTLPDVHTGKQKAGKSEEETEEKTSGNRKAGAERTEVSEKPWDRLKHVEPPEIYSSVLNGYLDNLKRIIPAFIEQHNEQLLWSQSLFLSIDDGYGMNTFMKALSGIYVDAGLCTSKDIETVMLKYKLSNPSNRDLKYMDWELLIKDMKKMAQNSERPDRLQRVIDIDLSKWIAELRSAPVKDYLSRLNEVNAQALFVFRVPYMEYRVVRDICSAVSDIIRVRPLSVAPADNEQMLKYMRTKAARYGFTFTPECDEILERGIVAEMNDGSFYGFTTLAQMVESILYDKIGDMVGKADQEELAQIKPDELKKYLNVVADDKTADELIAEMVGVDKIVEQVDTLINQISVQKKMSEQGKSLDRPTIHMFFTGSPGTGKTTMARIIAKKMKEAGILSKGNFYEIKGRDLCGEYIGETTPKTCGYCRMAYGSVLFIDEAYELFTSSDNTRDYGREAITALIAEMENHRDDMCVIMAGYTEEMKTLLESNPGLKSRVRTMIEFPNYSRSELEEIYFRMLEDNFAYDDSFKKAVHDYFDGLSDEVIDNKAFANGRFVRNLYENTWGIAAIRSEFDEEGRIKLLATDFTSATENTDASSAEAPRRRQMGFGTF